MWWFWVQPVEILVYQHFRTCLCSWFDLMSTVMWMVTAEVHVFTVFICTMHAVVQTFPDMNVWHLEPQTLWTWYVRLICINLLKPICCTGLWWAVVDIGLWWKGGYSNGVEFRVLSLPVLVEKFPCYTPFLKDHSISAPTVHRSIPEKGAVLFTV